MEFAKDQFERDDREIVALFAASFTSSEGPEEGAVIRGFVQRLLSTTPQADIHVFTAKEGAALIGGAIFSRLVYADDPRSVFILSPMAVAPERQGQGIGQGLLRYALTTLQAAGVDVAITYGDPAFYGKLGFQPLDESVAAAPMALSMPMGWIGQSLGDHPLKPLKGPCRCVEALCDPALW